MVDECEQKWTCKKCTLVNRGQSMTCEACYGSKLKSLTLNNDMTLRKGEFWSCTKCTLKNPLQVINCKACKMEKGSLEVTTAVRLPSPRHGGFRRYGAMNVSKIHHNKSCYPQTPAVKLKGRINLNTDLDQGTYRMSAHKIYISKEYRNI